MSASSRGARGSGQGPARNKTLPAARVLRAAAQPARRGAAGQTPCRHDSWHRHERPGAVEWRGVRQKLLPPAHVRAHHPPDAAGRGSGSGSGGRRAGGSRLRADQLGLLANRCVFTFSSAPCSPLRRAAACRWGTMTMVQNMMLNTKCAPQPPRAPLRAPLRAGPTIPRAQREAVRGGAVRPARNLPAVQTAGRTGWP